MTAPALAAAAALSVVAGLAVQRGYGPQLVVASLSATAIVLAGRWRRGVVIGLFVLSALDGLPFIEMTTLSGRVAPGSTDILVPVLVVALAAWNFEPGAGGRSPRLRRLAWLWGGTLAMWWVLIWTWSVTQGVPAWTAALYGRDFLYFAFLLPLAIGAVRGRDDLVALGSTLAGGALIYSAAQLLAQLTGFDPVNFVHANSVGESAGTFKRYFASMGALQGAGVPFGLGLVLLGRGARARGVGWIILAIAGTASVLQFTRAFYVGVALAFVLVTAVWAARSGEASRQLRRAAGVGAVALAVAVAVFAITGASLDRESAPSLVAERAASGLTQVRESSGTYGARRDIYDQMLDALGPNWPIGLGFLDPGAHYVTGIPRGEIRNTDVGLLNAVMTMGVVGLLLVLTPAVAVVAFAVRSASQPLADQWLAYGASVYLVLVLLTSPTLVVLFSAPGLVLTSIICAAACRVLEPQPG